MQISGCQGSKDEMWNKNSTILQQMDETSVKGMKERYWPK